MTDLVSLRQNLLKNCPNLKLLCAEPLCRHTSFRIGGDCALMAFVKDISQLSQILHICKTENVTPRILGAGTNVLAPDEGLDELVICTKDALTGLSADGSSVTAMAGESLCNTAVFAREHSLSGMEFAHGIPGTVGGGVFMNAAAYDGEIRNVCKSVTVMHFDGTTEDFSGDELFSYRKSVFQSMQCVIVKAEFVLTPGNKDEIQKKMTELMEKRKKSQPLELPSAGSTFKRPQNGYASALIDAAGLRGFEIGEAAVSEKHAGFVVNLGHATADDVLLLMKLVQKKVYAHSGVMLEPEIRIW